MIYFILAALIVLLDQMSKYLLTMKLSGGEIDRLLPGLLRMEYVRNTGAAFSFLSDMRWVLVAVSAVVIVLIAVGLIRYRDKIDLVGKLGLAFILGGALSNLADRALFGYVSDFFEFEFVRFAVFNVADIFITVGGVVFCLWYLFSGSKRDSLREEFMLGRKKKARERRTHGGSTHGGMGQNSAEREQTPEDSGGTDQT
jgi:signal peptidase II